MIRDSAALRNLGEHLLKFCSDVVAVLLKSPHSLPLSWGSSQTIPHSIWGSVWEMGHPPRTPSPAHSRHPHTLSQPHWGCALFPKHSAFGFGHVGPLTQHASRMPLHLFKSCSFLGAPQFRRRFCQEAFQVSPGGVTLSPSFLLSDRLCVALSYFFHSNVHSGEHVHFSSLCHTSCFGSQSLRTKVSGRHSRVPWA